MSDTATTPFLTAYDPPAASEGTIDPLGLYQIADQLATRLVPGVRERMQRVRFLTAMAVGALVTEGLEEDPEQPDAPPFIIWEWLVVEAMIRSMGEDDGLWGVPGTLVTRRALRAHGYIDKRSYLKTARIYGLHGAYKRLAIHLGLVDVHLGPRQECERLVDAWARDLGYGGLAGVRSTLQTWRDAVAQCLAQKPARTRLRGGPDAWLRLAEAMAPHHTGAREKRHLRELLHAVDDRAMGALPAIWRLQETMGDDAYSEELLHDRLEHALPTSAVLVNAIRTYERFCRSLLDAFDILRAEAAVSDALGVEIRSIGRDEEFATSLLGMERQYAAARQRLGEVDLQLMNLFDERFSRFAEPMGPGEYATVICEHHEAVQKAKSADGKRPWFDRLGPSCIYMRHQYREPRRPIAPDRYTHDYRGCPIRNFYFDLQ